MESKTVQNVNVNKNLRENITENIIPKKVCMFYELSKTILLLSLRYLHLDYFKSCTDTYLFKFNFVYTFSKIKLRPSSGRQVFLLTVNKPHV